MKIKEIHHVVLRLLQVKFIGIGLRHSSVNITVYKLVGSICDSVAVSFNNMDIVVVQKNRQVDYDCIRAENVCVVVLMPGFCMDVS